jgi:CP family cyanate transporter-like MFS transporter
MEVYDLKAKKTLFLFLAIIVIFCGLRAPITEVGSLVSTIRDGLGLSSTSAGMLTTIPLIAFGIISVFVGHFSDRLGAGKVMLVGLLLLVAGIVLRTFAVAAGLFIGTAIIGIGLAVGNVLIPAFIKAFFPEKVGTMTSAYTTSMSVFAGISGGISVPLAKAYGWQLSLFIWIIPAATALLLWLPNRNTVLAVKAKRASKGGSIAKDSMTWLISLYIGVQSLLFYCFVA